MMLRAYGLALLAATHTAMAAILYSEGDIILLERGNPVQIGLCNSTLAHANGTGIQTFNPGFVMAKVLGAEEAYDPIPDASWATTVKEDKGQVWTNFWFGPNGVQYWNDTLTQFDACVMMVAPPLAQNTIYLSQDDPGDCSVMLSLGCREAIIQKVQAQALLLTTYASPGEYSNLTATSLPYICNHIFDSLVQTDKTNAFLPSECDQDFDIPNQLGPTSNGWNSQDLTGNNITAEGMVAAYDDCPITGPDGQKYYSTLGFSVPSQYYDVAMRQATPLVTVYFTVANAAARLNVASYASAQLSCPRVQEVVNGSRVAPRLPSGTPYSSPSTLSTGDIAGIVIGAVAFLVMLAAVAFFIYRRSRRRRAVHQAANHGDKDISEDSLGSNELAVVEKAELSSNSSDCKPEIDGGQILEAVGSEAAAEVGTSKAKAELAGSTHVREVEGTNGAVELDANPRWSFSTDRRSIASFNTAVEAI